MATLDLAFSGGTTAVDGYGDRWQIGFMGTWAAGDWWGVEGINTTQGNFTVGRGDEAGTYTYLNGTLSSAYSAYTYRNRVYLANGDRFNFSEVGDPSGWEQQDPGAGYILFNTNNNGPNDTCVAFGSLQGHLAVFGRNNVQIWDSDADPDNFVLRQSLAHIGTLAPLSVQSLGDFDVMFLSDSGVRSLRALQLTENAFVNDVGSPIDSVIVASILASPSTSDDAVSTIDPITRQYWLYLNGVIYVLSLYPNEQITAWSTFTPTYFASGVDTTFAPVKFVIKDSQVFVLASDGKIFRYGGTDNNTYDATPATVETNWVGLPQEVQALACDFSMQGTWAFYAAMNYKRSPIPYSLVATQSSPTYVPLSFPYSAVGTHVRFKVTTSAASQAKLGAIVFKYNVSREIL